MESVQKELVSVLLDHVRSLGIISNSTYSEAVDLVHSVIDFPEVFQYPVCLIKEVNEYEHTQDT